MRVVQIHLSEDPTETLVYAHAELLPAEVSVVHGFLRPLYLDGEPLYPRDLRRRLASRARQEIWRMRGRDVDSLSDTAALLEAFGRARPDAVLAELGHVGVKALDACARARLPLIVYFHGYDVTVRPLLERNADGYRRMFRQAAALVGCSQRMREDLIALGAPPEKTHYVPCGVDPERFVAGDPSSAPPVFISVGRFVDKKAPELTILAFERVLRSFPEAQLRMVGDGELRGACHDIVVALEIADSVRFLLRQPLDVVAAEMRGARAFVQHSVVAIDGDSEGMPISVLEASATGLPVVSTRHAGIPEVVVEGETGFLVDEHDIGAMAAHMERLIADPALAARLGRAGRARVAERFTMEQSIAKLWDVIQQAASTTPPLAGRTD